MLICFTPREDITTWELARIYGLIAPSRYSLNKTDLEISVDKWIGMGDDLRRHFTSKGEE